jgi:hypothetical protein
VIDCDISITEVCNLPCTIEEKNGEKKLKGKVLAVALINLLQPLPSVVPDH